MRRKDFKTGDLAWISRVVDGWSNGMVQSKRGYPAYVKLVAGDPVTILRRAQAGDYGVFARHTHNGRSTGKRLADDSWLTLYGGRPVLIQEVYLNKRRYSLRKKPQQV
jgi:hypothetical protein